MLSRKLISLLIVLILSTAFLLTCSSEAPKADEINNFNGDSTWEKYKKEPVQENIEPKNLDKAPKMDRSTSAKKKKKK